MVVRHGGSQTQVKHCTRPKSDGNRKTEAWKKDYEEIICGFKKNLDIKGVKLIDT